MLPANLRYPLSAIFTSCQKCPKYGSFASARPTLQASTSSLTVLPNTSTRARSLEAAEGAAICRFTTLPAERLLRSVLLDSVRVSRESVPDRQLTHGADMLFNGEGEAFNVWSTCFAP